VFSRVIITHPEMGVYLGNCMGFGFWSKLDPVGQTHAVVFMDVDEAIQHIHSWDGMREPGDYVLLDVRTTEGGYASIAECSAAGADAWFPDAGDEPVTSSSMAAIH